MVLSSGLATTCVNSLWDGCGVGGEVNQPAIPTLPFRAGDPEIRMLVGGAIR